jgi:sulfur-oxidizing protein SoxZ
MARTLITIPPTAKAGEIIEIRVLIQHPMETGYRRSSEGAMLARNLIRRFTCRFESADTPGKTEAVFAATLYAAIAANPYLSFHTLVNRSGTFVLQWDGDNGFAQSERVGITVR